MDVGGYSPTRTYRRGRVREVSEGHGVSYGHKVTRLLVAPFLGGKDERAELSYGTRGEDERWAWHRESMYVEREVPA